MANYQNEYWEPVHPIATEFMLPIIRKISNGEYVHFSYFFRWARVKRLNPVLPYHQRSFIKAFEDDDMVITSTAWGTNDFLATVISGSGFELIEAVYEGFEEPIDPAVSTCWEDWKDLNDFLMTVQDMLGKEWKFEGNAGLALVYRNRKGQRLLIPPAVWKEEVEEELPIALEKIAKDKKIVEMFFMPGFYETYVREGRPESNDMAVGKVGNKVYHQFTRCRSELPPECWYKIPVDWRWVDRSLTLYFPEGKKVTVEFDRRMVWLGNRAEIISLPEEICNAMKSTIHWVKGTAEETLEFLNTWIEVAESL